MKNIFTVITLIIFMTVCAGQSEAQTSCNAGFVSDQAENLTTINFSDASISEHAITSWLWHFGDGTTSDAHNPSHTYIHEGTYNVCLTIHDASGCTSTFCHDVTVAPVVSTSCDASFTSHQTENTTGINFTNGSTSEHEITSWLWHFGDGTTSDSQNASHTYTHDGTYNVCLAIHDASGCTSTFCHDVVVAPVASTECNASFASHQTENTSAINFTDGSTSEHTINSWLWTFGDGTTSDSSHPTHTYTHSGTYNVCLTIHDVSGCTSTFCHDITVAAVVGTSCDASFTTHQAESTTAMNFIDGSASEHAITSWLWHFGDGTTSNSHNPSHTYAHPGTYNVCLTIHDASGCTNTFCHDISVAPVVSTSCAAAFSYHQSENSTGLNFTDASASDHAITSWLWHFGDGGTADSQNPSHTYTHEGTYTVCLTIHDASGCTSTFCHEVIINPVPMPSCQAAFTVHQADGSTAINLTDASSSDHAVTSWLWHFGDGTTSTQQNPHHTFDHSGHYNICLTISDSITGCSSTVCHVYNYHHNAHGHHSAIVPHSTFMAHSGNSINYSAERYIANYPNPVNTTATLIYELAYDADVKIEIFDKMGKKMESAFSSNQAAGIHNQEINAANLISGIYLIKVIVDGQVFNERIAVIN